MKRTPLRVSEEWEGASNSWRGPAGVEVVLIGLGFARADLRKREKETKCDQEVTTGRDSANNNPANGEPEFGCYHGWDWANGCVVHLFRIESAGYVVIVGMQALDS